MGNILDTDSKIKKGIEIYLEEDSQIYFRNCHKTSTEISKGHNEHITNGNLKKSFLYSIYNYF